MAKHLSAAALLGLALVVSAQPAGQRAQRQARPSAQQKTIEGATITRNKLTAKPGYELVRQSDTVIAVKHKKKKNPTGSLRCGCLGDGSCSLSGNDKNASCLGASCGENCTLYVEQTSVKAPVIR